ncbi:MAG: hypothetical protein ABSB97_07070, partial [Thermoplasmata archaeon]
NQIARVVTLLFGGPTPELNALRSQLALLLPKPFHVVEAGPSALSVPPGTHALQVVGEATHGGYPHRGHNPVPAAIDLLRTASEAGVIDRSALGTGTFTVDLRLIPEMELADGLRETLEDLGAWSRRSSPHSRVVAPPARCRSGYALPVDHPMVLRFERVLRDTLGAVGVRGEYGGTDASALRGLKTPGGELLPAIVFGSMDPEARIHDAEESADPRKIAAVTTTIERFVREP